MVSINASNLGGLYTNLRIKYTSATRAKLTSDGLAMLGVEGGVDFVEEVEGGGVALLNGEDERQRDETLLSTRQLLHLARLAGTRERHLSFYFHNTFVHHY